MTITVDWQNRIVNSDASITDILAFKEELRVLEDSATGILYPQIITFKLVDIGGGAFEYFIAFINSYQMRFPNAGNYEMIGNINTDVIPVAGVYVERTKAVAFASFATGSGLSTTQDLMLKEVYKRLDLDASAPNKHSRDSSQITNEDDINLVSTDNGDGTFTVQRQ